MSLYQPSRGCCNQPPWELLTMFQINSAQVFIDITTLLQCTKSLLIPLSAAISCMMAQTEVRHSGRAHQLHLNRHLPLALSASSQRLWKNTKYKTQITNCKLQTTNYELHITDHKSKIKKMKLQTIDTANFFWPSPLSLRVSETVQNIFCV